MDIRRIQKTGGSSFSVILPKKWVLQHKLRDKDLVKMSQEQSSVLHIQPSVVKKFTARAVVSLDECSDNELSRELIANYISGVDEIVISGENMKPEEKLKIRSVCNLLIGFELLDVSLNKIVIKNVFDPAKFPMSQNLEKMFLIVKSMIEDAHKALISKDVILAKDVIDRDFDIDKLHIAITRQLYLRMRRDVIIEESELSNMDLYFFQNISTQIERIADHTIKIAKSVSSADITGTPILISSAVINILIQLLAKAHVMTKTVDKKIAHLILDSSQEVENQIYSKKTKKHKPSPAWDVLEDSLDRIRGYIMNMAEATIDHAALQ